MNKVLFIDYEDCTGCKCCEMICSLSHEGFITPAKSRIQVYSSDFEPFDIPMVCFHCGEPYCMSVCPADALYRDSKTQAVLIDEKKCIKCRLCIMACPFGGIAWDDEKRRIIKCDLCNGEPNCVKFCEKQAIKYISGNKASTLKKVRVFEKISKVLKQES